MKSKLPFLKSGRWAAFPVAVFGSISLLHATPEIGPSGDEEVASFIQTDLRSDSRLKTATMAVKLDGGIATLTGQADSLAQIERATARANAVSQVKVVVNQMEVRDASEASIRNGAEAALKTQKLVRAESIKVSAAGSRLTLEGEVGTWDESDLAREVVSGIAGVTAVDNRITVNFEGERTDAQIAEQLRFIIQDDPLYDGLDLVASVKDGVVKLNGEVGSRAEFDRLVRRSYVTGVIEVKLNGLRINSDLAMEAVGDKDYTPDQSLDAAKAALAHDSRVRNGSVQPSVREGVLTLSGTVASIRERDAAESVARGIPGVLRVSNELRIGDAGETKIASPPLVRPRR